jgi:hypothetical protein
MNGIEVFHLSEGLADGRSEGLYAIKSTTSLDLRQTKNLAFQNLKATPLPGC